MRTLIGATARDDDAAAHGKEAAVHNTTSTGGGEGCASSSSLPSSARGSLSLLRLDDAGGENDDDCASPSDATMMERKRPRLRRRGRGAGGGPGARGPRRRRLPSPPSRVVTPTPSGRIGLVSLLAAAAVVVGRGGFGCSSEAFGASVPSSRSFVGGVVPSATRRSLPFVLPRGGSSSVATTAGEEESSSKAASSSAAKKGGGARNGSSSKGKGLSVLRGHEETSSSSSTGSNEEDGADATNEKGVNGKEGKQQAPPPSRQQQPHVVRKKITAIPNLGLVASFPPERSPSSTDNNDDSALQNDEVFIASFNEDQYADTPIPVSYVAETNLPTDVGHFRLRAYRVSQRPHGATRNRYVGTEPCVIYCTDKPPFGDRGEEALGKEGGHKRKGLPVRIHDQCFTSEVFRSQRCDCKEQLKMSLEYIKEHGGAIIYLQQEGRGIGLANKVAAYALQDVGMDTVDANLHLGFPEDCRQYGVVPSILHDMGIGSIQLITNNPRKIDRLSALGVDVEGTIPMVVERSNPFNRKYLETKRDRMAHTNFGDMLAKESRRPADYVRTPLPRAMVPQRKPAVAEDYINEGEEMAAAAVAQALLDDVDDDGRTGVSASSDGYCFGRKSVEDAIAAIKRGELVVVVDDESRENEGDFIMAADLATPETMATIVRYSSGVVCVGMEGKRMDELELPAMVKNNEDPKGTAFSVTVDASKQHGISTGISAFDRAKTVQLLASNKTSAADFVRPGHIFPLRAKENGVLTRDGHTEAAVDLSRLAGCSPCGVLCEIVSEEDPVNMARLPELKRFCAKHGYVLTSIVDLAQYRRDTEL